MGGERAAQNGGRHAPRDDLAGHLVPRVGEVAREAEIGDLELAVGRDEQVVGLEILPGYVSGVWGGGVGAHTDPVEDEVPVTELESAKCHGHPAFDVRGEEDERAIFNDELKVGVEKFENKIEILL